MMWQEELGVSCMRYSWISGS